MSLMPVLSTPLYTPANSTSAILHLDKIVYLTQFLLDGNPCILSLSRDGVVNVWSSNLLVEPKLSLEYLDLKGKLVVNKLCMDCIWDRTRLLVRTLYLI